MVTKSNIMGFWNTYADIIHWFFDYPTVPISLSELASELEISKSTAHRVVTALVREGFLNKEQIGRAWRITCNLSHPYNVTRKIPYHLQLVYESGVVDAVNGSVPDNNAIVLFGSYRRGDDTHESDLDIAVEVSGDRPSRHIELGSIDLGFRKDVSVNLLVFSRRRVDLNVFANIANGIVLQGFLEVKP